MSFLTDLAAKMNPPNATDAVNAYATLQSFWSSSDQPIVSSAGPINQAMKTLMRSVWLDPSLRASLFVSNAVFSTALLDDDPAIQRNFDLSSIGPGFQASSTPFSGDFYAALRDYDVVRDTFPTTDLNLYDSPRKIMLREIRLDIGQSFWHDADPTGLASWLLSSDVAGTAIANTVASDPDPEVRLEALTFLNKVAYPVEWQPQLNTALAKLFEVLPQLQMWQKDATIDAGLRSTLYAAAKTLQSTISIQAAQIASKKLPLLPATFGDGKTSQMVPPASRAWWANWMVWASGLVGVAGGAWAADKRPGGRKTSP